MTDRNAPSFFRPDIEGLRAVAVLLVIGAHFAIPGFAGGFIGVDIFFVISGYLITSILVREHENTGNIVLIRFYANRLRRLLPALIAMLVISSLLAFQLLPIPQHLEQSQAAVMASAWISNIYFTFSDVDYFKEEATNNLFLHTWSLGVEEQFYLIWPLGIAALLLWSKGRKQEPVLTALFVVIAIVSLASCILISFSQPNFSFYMMPTRAWQFAAGALAWLLSRQHPLQTYASAIGGLGIFILITGLAIIRSNAVYPGGLALLPTLGTCFLLWAGTSQAHSALYTLLSSKPMQTIGRLSYSWYLWHWPILILGESVLPIKGHMANTVLAISLSLIAAALTHYLIENPIRYGRPARLKHGWQIALALFAITTINAQFLRWNDYTQERLASNGNDIYYRVNSDIPIIYNDKCDDWYNSAEIKPCQYGNADAEKTAVLLGDSIGAQWFPTLSTMLDPQQWKIIVLTKSSCPIVDEPYFYERIGREYTECAIWRDKAIQWIKGQHIDRIFIGSTSSNAFTDTQWINGTRRILDKLAQRTTAIYLIEANPTLAFNGPQCLMKHSVSEQKNCQSPAGPPQYAHVAALLEDLAKNHPKTHWLETSSFVCPAGQCQAMRGGMIIFRDSQHLTASFTASAAPHFLEQIQHYEKTIK